MDKRLKNYVAIIQNDCIGNTIDIAKKESDLYDFVNDKESYTVLPLIESVEYVKKHPNKKYFIYNEEKFIIDFLKNKNVI